MFSLLVVLEIFLRKVECEWEGKEESKGIREREREAFFLAPLTKPEKVTVSSTGNHKGNRRNPQVLLCCFGNKRAGLGLL